MKHKKITERVVLYIMSCSLGELSQLTRYKIAEEFKINTSYLSQKFKRDTRMSLFQFIESEKMNHAKTLLRNRQDMTVKEISRMYGLEKTEQFRARFKKFFYITPGKYRSLFKNEQKGGF